VPANLHPDISKTVPVTCPKFKKNVILAPLSYALEPRGSGAKIFFAYFFLVRAMTPLYFQIEILKKNFGENIPPGGLTPKIFGKVDVSPRVTCLQICIHYIAKTVAVDVC